MILKFDNFINELYKSDPTDSETMRINKDRMNKIDKDTREYQQNKNQVKDILKKSVEDKNVISKLKGKRLIKNVTFDDKNPQRVKSTNVTDTKGLVWNNEYLGFQAEIGRLQREIEVKNKAIQVQQETIKNRQQSISEMPELKDSLTQEIKECEKRIANHKKSMDDIKSRITKLETAAKQKIQQDKKELLDRQQSMSKELASRKQTSITQ